MAQRIGYFVFGTYALFQLLAMARVPLVLAAEIAGGAALAYCALHALVAGFELVLSVGRR